MKLRGRRGKANHMAVRRAPLPVGPRAAADGNPAPPGESSKGPGLDGEFRQLVDIADEGVKLVNDAELRLKKRACDNPKDLAAWLRRLQSAKEDLDDALDEFRASMAAQRRRPEQDQERKKSVRPTLSLGFYFYFFFFLPPFLYNFAIHKQQLRWRNLNSINQITQFVDHWSSLVPYVDITLLIAL